MKDFELTAIEQRYVHGKAPWVSGPSARRDVALLVAEIRRLIVENARLQGRDLIPPAPPMPGEELKIPTVSWRDDGAAVISVPSYEGKSAYECTIPEHIVLRIPDMICGLSNSFMSEEGQNWTITRTEGRLDFEFVWANGKKCFSVPIAALERKDANDCC